jgi:hypothetical protein
MCRPSASRLGRRALPVRRRPMDFGDLANLANKAKDLAADNADKITDAIDKAGDVVGEKLGHEDKVDMVAEKLKGLIPNNPNKD